MGARHYASRQKNGRSQRHDSAYIIIAVAILMISRHREALPIVLVKMISVPSAKIPARTLSWVSLSISPVDKSDTRAEVYKGAAGGKCHAYERYRLAHCSLGSGRGHGRTCGVGAGPMPIETQRPGRALTICCSSLLTLYLQGGSKRGVGCASAAISVRRSFTARGATRYGPKAMYGRFLYNFRTPRPG
jgi:hypothetical protein